MLLEPRYPKTKMKSARNPDINKSGLTKSNRVIDSQHWKQGEPKNNIGKLPTLNNMENNKDKKKTGSPIDPK